jgi:hypothetical protein
MEYCSIEEKNWSIGVLGENEPRAVIASEAKQSHQILVDRDRFVAYAPCDDLSDVMLDKNKCIRFIKEVTGIGH